MIQTLFDPLNMQIARGQTSAYNKQELRDFVAGGGSHVRALKTRKQVEWCGFSLISMMCCVDLLLPC